MDAPDGERQPGERPADKSPSPRRRGRRIARLLLAAIAAALFLGALFVFAVWLWWLPDPDNDQRSRGVNALWAAHTWVGDEHTDAEYRELAAHLRRHEISDVFFHAGPLDADGRVSGDLIEHAPALLAAMDRYAPAIRTQAYLGQIEDRAGGILDLDDEGVRTGIVETAEDFLILGFEGIHYDIEPIHPDDESFIDLLDRTHALTQSRGAVLSVALEQMEVTRAQRVVGFLLRRSYHDPSSGFLREVAERVDQLAIMSYDTGLPADWLFGAHIAWQTEHVVEAIGEDVTVFIGVPTYDSGTFGRFHAHAENMDSGVRGIRKGLDRVARDRSENVGIAIFAEWTTTEDEWDAYYAAWVQRD